VIQNLVSEIPLTGDTTLDYVTRHFIPIKAWNLGLVELVYLIPVNALILWLAFRPTKRMPAGFIVVLAGMLYAPVRFFLDFLRPEHSDPRHLGLTFAQWASIAAFSAAAFVALRIMKTGQPAKTVTATSREAQERLRVILNEDDDDDEGKDDDKGEKKAGKTAKPAAKTAPRSDDPKTRTD
jgi:hypothetical protein